MFEKYFKSIILNGEKFKLNDKIFFEEPIIHPFDGSKITYGLLAKIDNYFKPEKVTLYLADAMHYDSFCSSYLKEFTLEELEDKIENEVV